jgi:hypothetical protein
MDPTGETITVEGIVEAVLPGAWAPAIIRPLIVSPLLCSPRSTPPPVFGWSVARRIRCNWAALVGAVPVLTLVVAYAQVARFQGDFPGRSWLWHWPPR